jgi:hypothetical protein
MTMLFKDIESGQRCLFYTRHLGQETEIIMFRANFIDIIDTTLRVNKVDCQQNRSYHQGGLLTMPLAWVTKIETLDDITYEKILLPSEIMLDIDLFV